MRTGCARIADRHFGVGCDQILVIERPRSPGTDFYYRIFNADGAEVQHCGNGARCFLRYVRDKGLTDKTEIRVETLSGVIVPRLEADGQVTVDMGPPEFEPAKIPFVADKRALTYRTGGGRQAGGDQRIVDGQPACRAGGRQMSKPRRSSPRGR